VDDQRGIVDPLGMAGKRLEVRVHIVTGAVTSAQNMVRACQKSGLAVSDIVLESLASSKAVLTQEERELGVVLVDLGGGTTDFAVFHNDAIKYTGVLAMGGQNLTNDIAYGLHTPMASAESTKIRYGCAMTALVGPDEMIKVPSVGGREPRPLSRQILAEICQPRMEEILYLVDQELTRSGNKHLARAGVVLTGGAALIAGCQELAEQIFNLPTRLGKPLNIGGLRDMVDSPKYATAVGLLCYGAEKEAGARPLTGKGGSSATDLFGRILRRMASWFKDIS
jgi:cell division protein FtsA